MANENFIKIADFLSAIEAEIASAIALGEHSQNKQSVLIELLIKAKNQATLISEALQNENLKEALGAQELAIEFQDEAREQVPNIAELSKKTLKAIRKIETETSRVIHELIQLKNQIKNSEAQKSSEKLFKAALLLQKVQESSEKLIYQIEILKVEEIDLALKKTKEATELIKQAVIKIQQAESGSKNNTKNEASDLVETAQINLNTAFGAAQALNQLQAQVSQTIKQIQRQFAGVVDFISV